MRTILNIRWIGILSLGALALSATPRRASAQFQPTSSTAACVGGAIGCSQIDLFLSFLALPSDGLTVDRFTLSLATTAFRFASPGVTEAEDAFGFNFYNPSVSSDQGTLIGAFDFGAFVHPDFGRTLRLRVEMGATPTGAEDASSFFYDYSMESAGAVIATGGFHDTPVTATPEPGTLLLMASGLAVVGGIVRRQRAA